jgi:hypothetical protein
MAPAAVSNCRRRNIRRRAPSSSAILPSESALPARVRRACAGFVSVNASLHIQGIRLTDGHLKCHSQRCRAAVNKLFGCENENRAAALATRMKHSLDLPPPLASTQGEFVSFRRSSGVQRRAARLIQTLRSHLSPAATLNYVYALM